RGRRDVGVRRPRGARTARSPLRRREHMTRLIFRILATIGGAVVGAVLLGVAARYLWRGHVPARTVVEVDLERPLVEYVPDDPLANPPRRQRPRLPKTMDCATDGPATH